MKLSFEEIGFQSQDKFETRGMGQRNQLFSYFFVCVFRDGEVGARQCCYVQGHRIVDFFQCVLQSCSGAGVVFSLQGNVCCVFLFIASVWAFRIYVDVPFTYRVIQFAVTASEPKEGCLGTSFLWVCHEQTCRSIITWVIIVCYR